MSQHPGRTPEEYWNTAFREVFDSELDYESLPLTDKLLFAIFLFQRAADARSIEAARRIETMSSGLEDMTQKLRDELDDSEGWRE